MFSIHPSAAASFSACSRSGAAAATAAPLAPAVADSERAEKRKPRYQANSPEVQTFYRVNRYPAK